MQLTFHVYKLCILFPAHYSISIYIEKSCIKYYKYSRDDLKYIEVLHRIYANITSFYIIHEV